MNIDYGKILRSLYAIDTALATFSNAPSFTTYRGKMSSHYAISVEREVGTSQVSLEKMMTIRDNAIQLCIQNGILNFFRQSNGYDAFEGVENGQLFSFLSEKSYRKVADKSTVKRDSLDVFNDYSKGTISFKDAYSLLSSIPENSLANEQPEKLRHSKEAMKNLLGVVNGFDFSNCYDENGLVEIDFHDIKTEAFDTRKAKASNRSQFGRR